MSLLFRYFFIFLMAMVVSTIEGKFKYANAKGHGGGGGHGGGPGGGENSKGDSNRSSNIYSNPKVGNLDNNVRQRGLSSLQILDPGKANKNEKSQSARLSATVRFINRFDANGDGQVSRNEVDNLNVNKFNDLNKDETGNISKQDLISTLADRLNEETSTIFNSIDKNNDGLISSQESFNTYNQLKNRGADLDNDGRISLEEYNNYNLQQVVDGTLEKLDSNKDGQISLEEFSENSISQFENLDQNNNEIVTIDN